MTITASVAVLNIVLGVVYTSYGSMTLIDMTRNRRMGFSHFGAAWVAMAFTCGPHHLHHGLHIAIDGYPGGVLDVVAVVVGLPAGLAWFLLRVEAFTGGRGDRLIGGSPVWVILLPTIAGAYAAAMVAAVITGPSLDAALLPVALASFLLVAIYGVVGYYLIRTQLANRRPLGGWSVSGLSLAMVFPTCAVMHGMFGVYLMEGRYPVDTHNLLISWLAIPAGIYFLWVVRALYKGTFRDWNGTPALISRSAGRRKPEAAPARP